MKDMYNTVLLYPSCEQTNQHVLVELQAGKASCYMHKIMISL